MPFREIEHTSETGFVADGGSLEEVFAEAGRALFEVMTDISGIDPAVERKVALEGEDLPGLMHAWLEELNFLSQTEHEFYVDFDVRIEETRLSAVLGGEPIDFKKHKRRLEVKAVTYGDYYFRKIDDGWQVRVVLDV
jgi:SHS2 domain-containing protein